MLSCHQWISKLLDNGVGYIQVSEFQTNTASQFEDAR